MKNSLLKMVVVLGSTFVWSHVALAVDAAGEVFYKKSSGEIVLRSVTLEVPSQGQGDVLLKAPEGNVKAEAFEVKHVGNRVVFYVAFPVPEDVTKIAVFKGTYLRGSNLAAYYGDVFETGRQNLGVTLGVPVAKQQLARFDEVSPADVIHLGGFGFRAPILPAE